MTSGLTRSVYNLDNLGSVGALLGTASNGAVVDVKSGQGFAISRPTLLMFDFKNPEGAEAHSVRQRVRA